MVDGQQPSAEGASLQDRAFGEIKDRILTGQYPPGTFLSAREIAHELQMSKTPVQGAFGRLGLAGFVTVSPQRGAVVRAPTLREILEQYDLRAALETHVVRKLANRLSKADAARLQELLEGQEAAIADADLRRYVALDAEFHVSMSEASGNRELARIMRELRDLLQRSIEFGWQARETGSGFKDHQEILRLVLEGDGEGAAQAVTRHLRRATGRWVDSVGAGDVSPLAR